jgi:hypothetical protein
MSILKFLREGILLIADFNVESRNYRIPKAGGFTYDQQRLSGDYQQVGLDMEKVINRHYGSKQPYKRSGA